MVKSHVIWNDVLQPLYIEGGESRFQFYQLLQCSQFRVDLVKIRSIIAVHTTWACLEDRGSINGINTQLMQVVHYLFEMLKSEILIKLDTVRAARYVHYSFAKIKLS